MWYFWWLVITFLGLVLGVACDKDFPEDGFCAIMLIFLVIRIITDIVSTTSQKVNSCVNEYRENRIPNDNYLDKLEKLTILRLQGALTDDEFEKMKEKVLRKIL